MKTSFNQLLILIPDRIKVNEYILLIKEKQIAKAIIPFAKKKNI
jgi:hypothetical protein